MIERQPGGIMVKKSDEQTLGRLLLGAIDDYRGNPTQPLGTAREREAIFEFFLRHHGASEDHRRAVYRFWFERAAPPLLERDARRRSGAKKKAVKKAKK
jgi:hypothetical protein